MPGLIQEHYTPKPMAASGLVLAGFGGLAGFFCTAAGTLELRDGSAAGAVVVVAFPVAVGTFYNLPFAFPNGVYATLGGDAGGTFAVIQQ